jgi:AcrR family transcriptional regulator
MAREPRSERGPGRAAQRRRTRAAIVDAATRLLAEGRTPSVDEIAAAADVSRRTVYMYFPTLDQLLLDATVGALSATEMDAAMTAAAGGDDPVAGVDALVSTSTRLAPVTLPLGRKIIRLTVDTEKPAEPGTDAVGPDAAGTDAVGPDAAGTDAAGTDAAGTEAGGSGAPRRGFRRVAWVEQAVGPLRGELTDEQFERLVSALCLVVGWEAHIILEDVRGLAPQEEERVLRWAARALVDAARTEADTPRADADTARAEAGTARADGEQPPPKGRDA